MSRQISLQRQEGAYSVARLDPGEPVPDWAEGAGFASITRTDDELSIICLDERIPSGAKAARGWVCYKFMGPFAFEAAGVILTVIRPLSENGIGVLVVSSFDGDIIFIRSSDTKAAEDLVQQAGHRLV